MPGPVVHLIVQQRLARALRDHDPGSPHAKAMAGHSPFAAFGSMGPDFLFFSLRDTAPAAQELTNTIFGIVDAFEPLITAYETHVEPVIQQVEDAITTADDALLQGLLQQVKGVVDGVTATALTAVQAIVVNQVDFFFYFKPVKQEDKPEHEWFWFDLLHYRRTGAFCDALWQNAAGDADLQAYVLGYASHIASDVVGHPFVNSIVGGPYRTNWHRHKVVENFIDAYARRRYRDTATSLNALALKPDDRFTPDSIAGSYWHRLVELPGGTMPSNLGRLLARTMKQVYGHIGHAHPMSATDLDSTYRLWLLWFKRTTELGAMQRPPARPMPGGAATALVQDLFNGMPPAPGAGSVPPGSFGPAAVLAALLAAAQHLADVAAYVGQWLVDKAADIVALPAQTALEVANYGLYQLRLALFKLYDELRFSIVLQGYLFPEARDLGRAPWAAAFTNTASAHATGGGAPPVDPLEYPRGLAPYAYVGATEVHLHYPTVVVEQPLTTPMPERFFGRDPEAFIDEVHPFRPEVEKLYACTDDGDTDDLDRTLWRETAQFGSALSFSARLINDFLDKQPLPNFNLDGDRGYAYKTWQPAPGVLVSESSPQPGKTLTPLDVEYVDAP